MLDPHLGYLDAGTGSMLLQLFAGGLAAVAVFARLFWSRILTFLRIRKPEPEEVAAAPEPPAGGRSGGSAR